MGLWDIKPYSSVRGGTFSVRSGPMNASEAFLPGHVVFVNSDGEVATAPSDGTQFVLADAQSQDAVGIAINGPGAAATAELVAADGWGVLHNHPDTGLAYATGDRIWYVPFGEGNLFVTRNVHAAGGSGAGAAPNGADRGDPFQLTYESGSTPDLGWGIERTAGVEGTDFVAHIQDVVDANGQSVDATTDGVAFIFTVTNF